MLNYKYLKKYVGHNDLKGTYFISVKKNEIELAEKNLGFTLPVHLRQFYKTIGHGILSCGKEYPEMYIDTGGNLILPPEAVSAFYKPLVDDSRGKIGCPLSTKDEEYWMSDSTYEDLEPGDMPFFEVCNGSQYLVMRPHSDNPNAVWSDLGEKVEDSFEKFIWRLYHEHPLYYLKVLDPDYPLNT